MWTILGFVLLSLEMSVAGTLFLLFFGFGGILTGIFVALGVVSGPYAWLFFAVTSLLGVVLLRKKVKSYLARGGRASDEEIVGEIAISISELKPGGAGDVELRGTTWKARNVGDTLIPSNGTTCSVVSIEGLTLCVKIKE